MVNTTDNTLVSLKEKIKSFFKKMSNEKDTNVAGKGNTSGTNSQNMYRDDLKMY